VSGAPPPLAGRLVLRRIASFHDSRRVLRERAAHDAAVATGYPAPRVFLAETDPEPLGGSCLVMEWLPGRPLPDVQRIGLGTTLGDLQARLHQCDPGALIAAFERYGLTQGAATFASHLEQIASRIRKTGARGLDPALAWAAGHVPRDGSSPVICHGDFHPLNVMADSAGVTGVIDWPHAIVADPCTTSRRRA
jgi:aminoglycoside phosphotransferase (APT) family kinase protein